MLSPILFSIFINGMAKDIIKSEMGIPIRNKKMSILLYADDIVLITEKQQDLEKGMDIVANFEKKWRCKYSAKKTQVVIFGKRKTKKTKKKWKMGELEIKQVNSYKYLGLETQEKLV